MKKLIFKYFFFFWGLSMALLGYSQQSKDLSIKLTPHWGIDLSDSYAGTTKSGARDYTNHYIIKLDASRNWYGATAFYSIFKNSYLVISDPIERDLLPTMVSGEVGGLGVFAKPIKLKRFELQLNIGLLYGGMSQLHWQTYTKLPNGQVTNIVYKKISSMGRGFYWGTSLNFPISKQIGINMDIRLDDFDDELTGLSTHVIASVGCFVTLNP